MVEHCTFLKFSLAMFCIVIVLFNAFQWKGQYPTIINYSIMCVFPGEMCWNKMFLVLTGILTRIGFSRMLSRSHGCSGSGWPLWTTLSGSKVPFFMALMRRFLLTLRRNLPKVWACSLPRKVRLSCLENMVVADSSRRWDFNARAAAPTASTPVAAHEVHAVPRDEARGIWGSPCFTTGDCDREFGRASIVRKDLWRLWRPHTATAASKRPQRKESRCIFKPGKPFNPTNDFANSYCLIPEQMYYIGSLICIALLHWKSFKTCNFLSRKAESTSKACEEPRMISSMQVILGMFPSKTITLLNCIWTQRSRR